MSKTYLITFTPLGNFYFGTPKSFEESFYVSSDYLPTQSSILGLLRYQILKQNNLLDKNDLPDKTKEAQIKELTGEINYDLEKILFSNTSGNFGKLIKISPIFICYTYKGSFIPNDFLLPLPNDVIISSNSIEILKPKLINNSLIFEKNKNNPTNYFGGISFWQNYLSNKDIHQHYVFSFDYIFTSFFKYGIQRKNRITEEEKFYIKRYYTLNNGFSFGVIIHSDIEIHDDDVFLGGERSLFKMSVFEVNDNLKCLLELHPVINRFLTPNDFGDFYSSNYDDTKFYKFILVSHFVNDSKVTDYHLAYITNLYSFRMFDRKRIKTDTIKMLPRKSVLYFKELQQFKLNFYPTISSIGLNFAIKSEVFL